MYCLRFSLFTLLFNAFERLRYVILTPTGYFHYVSLVYSKFCLCPVSSEEASGFER